MIAQIFWLCGFIKASFAAKSTISAGGGRGSISLAGRDEPETFRAELLEIRQEILALMERFRSKSS